MKSQKILIILALTLISIFAGCGEPLNITTPEMISLHDAVIDDDIERLESNISKRAWLDLKNESGWTDLHYAVVKNNLKMIQLLINAGSDINIRDEKGGQTPLHFAAMTEKKQAVEILLANGANPYKKDINNKTPKQLATDKEIIDLFHQYGY